MYDRQRRVTVEVPLPAPVPAGKETESTAVSSSDATPQGRTTDARHEDTQAASVGLVDELLQTRQHHPNLARGIVWADILADIAADEEERRLRRGGSATGLREAA
jgi:hypothetical protein